MRRNAIAILTLGSLVALAGCDGGSITEELAPVLDGSVRRDQRRGALVAPHDDLEEILGGRVRELPHAEVVDDE